MGGCLHLGGVELRKTGFVYINIYMLQRVEMVQGEMADEGRQQE